MKLSFDPAVKGGTPSLTLSPNPAVPDTPVIKVRITAYALEGKKEVILDTRDTGHKDTLKYLLPARDKNEILGVRVEKQEGSKPVELAEWRAVYDRGRSLIEYRGTDELQCPADFDRYWDKAKQELAAIDINPEITPVPDRSTETGDLYRVKLNSYGNIPIVCWYFVPKGLSITGAPANLDKKYPVVQLMPGWGAEAGPVDWTGKGFITLSLNPRTHGPSREYFTTPIHDHHLWNIEDPRTYYYRAAYMDCLRGIDFLATRPEVDMQRIGLQGSSQGGAFCLATAALDQRVACVAADVPFLGNIPDFIKLATIGAGTKFGQMIDGSEKGNKVKRTLSYIDVSFMAQRVTCPTLVCVGLQDRVCPPLTGISAFNNLDGTNGSLRRLVMDPVADHEVTGLMWQENHDWLAKHLLK